MREYRKSAVDYKGYECVQNPHTGRWEAWSMFILVHEASSLCHLKKSIDVELAYYGS